MLHIYHPQTTRSLLSAKKGGSRPSTLQVSQHKIEEREGHTYTVKRCWIWLGSIVTISMERDVCATKLSCP